MRWNVRRRPMTISRRSNKDCKANKVRRLKRAPTVNKTAGGQIQNNKAGNYEQILLVVVKQLVECCCSRRIGAKKQDAALLLAFSWLNEKIAALLLAFCGWREPEITHAPYLLPATTRMLRSITAKPYYHPTISRSESRLLQASQSLPTLHVK